MHEPPAPRPATNGSLPAVAAAWPWRRRLLALGGVLALTLAAGGALVAAVLDSEALVTQRSEAQPQDIARAYALLRSQDPRRFEPGVLRALHLSQRDADVLLGQAGALRPGLAAALQLQPGAAELQLSLAPDGAWRPGWLNLRARLEQTPRGAPHLAGLQLGSLPLPPALALPLARWALRQAGMEAALGVAAGALHSVQFTAGHLVLQHRLSRDDSAQLLAALVAPAELQRLRAYTEVLAAQTAGAGGWTVLPLASLLGPVFDLARARSALPAGSSEAAQRERAAAENRSALLVLTLHASGRPLHGLLPVARSWAQPRPMRLLVGGRDDFPLHILISATLAAEVTGPLARAVGIYKEVADSRRGSGFSFNDMAANRVGQRLGEMAVAEPMRLQALLAAGVDDAALLPAVADLPEFMPEGEFLRRFGGVGQPPYQAMMAEIERRIAAMPLLQ